MITSHHIYLTAPGGTPEEIRRFYQKGLGLREVATPESLSQVSVLWFAAGPIVFHVGFPPTGTVGDGHTALATDDLDATRQQLSRAGFSIDDNVIAMGYPRFYTRDSWGNQFEILPAGLP